MSRSINIELLTYPKAALLLSKMGGILTFRSYSMVLQLFFKRLILAQNNPELLAAFSGVAAFEDIIFVFSFGCMGIISPIISATKVRTELATTQDKYLDPTILGIQFRSGFFFAAALMIPISVVCLFAPSIYRLAKQPDIVIENSASYFKYALFAYLFDFMYRVGVRFMVGLEKATSALLADILEGVLDVFFTYALVNGKYGFPEMGLAGSALAYAIAAFITLLIHTTFIYFRKDLKKYELFRLSDCFSLPALKEMLIKGLPLGLSESVGGVCQLMMIFYCGLFGPTALLAMQVAASYSLWLTMPVSAFSDTASVLIAKKVENKSPDYRALGNAHLLGSISYAGICSLLLFLFTENFTKLFIGIDSKNQSDVQMGMTLHQC